MATRFIPLGDLESRMARAREAAIELDRQQSKIAQRARGNLASVRDTGAHQITTARGAVDRYIQLEGPAPLSLEVGHFTYGRRVAGRNILRNA